MKALNQLVSLIKRRISFTLLGTGNSFTACVFSSPGFMLHTEMLYQRYLISLVAKMLFLRFNFKLNAVGSRNCSLGDKYDLPTVCFQLEHRPNKSPKSKRYKFHQTAEGWEGGFEPWPTRWIFLSLGGASVLMCIEVVALVVVDYYVMAFIFVSHRKLRFLVCVIRWSHHDWI